MPAPAGTDAMSGFKPAVIFFDCDDCLYKNDWKVANMLTRKIESFARSGCRMKEGTRTSCTRSGARACGEASAGGHPELPELLEEYLEYSHTSPCTSTSGPIRSCARCCSR